MSAGAQAALLPDGARLHLHHGPIDLIIGVEGRARDACFAQAAQRFESVLDELVPDLPVLRSACTGGAPPRALSPIAQRMWTACRPHAALQVTPMAAVAGAVADEVLLALTAGHSVQKAYVNNGGDISVHLQTGTRFDVRGPSGTIRLEAEHGAGGVASSGWGGRSHSLGIADTVTVIAETAAAADVAATLIANAVDLPGHPAIARVPAAELSPDSDLGTRLVTVDVGVLSAAQAAEALQAGCACAREMLSKGLILQAILLLQGQVAIVEKEEALHA